MSVMQISYKQVKTCYKIKIDSRVLDCCFYGVLRKRIRDASIYTSKNIAQVFILERYFFFPFVRQ